MSILGLGPLTNIAGAIGLDPGLVNKVSCIYISDGAVYVKGAINQEYPAIHNTVSGWNQWVDAKAADIVFGSAAKIVLVPLDLTALHSPHPVLLKEGLVRRYSNTVRNVAGKSLATLFQNWIAYYHADTQIQNSDDQAPVWDLVTAAIFVNPDLCSKRQDHSIIIDTGGPDTAGQIIISDQKDPNVSICLEGSQTLFDEVILQSAAMDPVITP
jgi:inosine-uridine nucleoside N-ribohydrolase